MSIPALEIAWTPVSRAARALLAAVEDRSVCGARAAGRQAPIRIPPLLNLKTAKALGAEALVRELTRADEVIE
jgi:hypothetical protein